MSKHSNSIIGCEDDHHGDKYEALYRTEYFTCPCSNRETQGNAQILRDADGQFVEKVCLQCALELSVNN